MRISDWSSDVCSSDLDRGPEIAATLAQTRIAIQQAGDAAEQIGQLAGTTNDILDKEGRPLMADLRKTVATAQRSMENLDAAISDVQPGLHKFSNSTIPEVDILVRDLRTMSKSLRGLAENHDQKGAGYLWGTQ